MNEFESTHGESCIYRMLWRQHEKIKSIEGKKPSYFKTLSQALLNFKGKLTGNLNFSLLFYCYSVSAWSPRQLELGIWVKIVYIKKISFHLNNNNKKIKSHYLFWWFVSLTFCRKTLDIHASGCQEAKADINILNLQYEEKQHKTIWQNVEVQVKKEGEKKKRKSSGMNTLHSLHTAALYQSLARMITANWGIDIKLSLSTLVLKNNS